MSLAFTRALVGGLLTALNLSLLTVLPLVPGLTLGAGQGLAHLVGLVVGLALLQQAFTGARRRV